MRPGLIRLLLLTVILGVLMGSGTAVGEQTPSCTITVQPGESIQAAIDAAPVGAVICLKAGTYAESITVRKSLTLRGISEEKSRIEWKEWDSSVIHVESDGQIEVRLEELTVSEAAHETRGAPRSPGGLVPESRGIIREEEGLYFGLRFVRTNRAGISVSGSARIVLSHVSMAGHAVGVQVESQAQAVIRECTIATSDYGLVLFNSSRAEIENCTLHGNTNDGVVVWEYANVVIRNCTVTGSGQNGIWVGFDSRVTIEACVVGENGENGIVVACSAQLTLDGNVIKANAGYGVALYERPCFDKTTVFTGLVTGGGNTIPDPNEPDGNKLGAVCPETLRFLMTVEGGELDRRPAP